MSLLAELRRRNVFRVAIAYGVVAWVLAQIADLAFENFGAPDWVAKSVLFILALGFPLAVIFAWAFELTPEGIKREKDVDRDESITTQTGKKLNGLIIALLVVAVVVLLVERSFRVPATPPEDVVATDASRLSIAVLPFDNRSNREEDVYFTEGIHDDLLTTMANIGSMKVISRTSVLEYKDTTKKIPEIARELGVANVLEGGVQRSGDHVRINVQLIDAETDEHLWAQIYDRELTAENLFKIQSEVARAIAEALQATLSPDEAQRLDAIPTDNLEAYEAYLLGRQRWEQRTAESTAEAAELFQKAVELDPEFAEAWAGLGDAYRHQVYYGGLPPDEQLPRSEQAIRRALELNSELAEAHAALGGLMSQLGRTEDSLVHLERAIELNPNYAPAYNWLGVTYNLAARFDEAASVFRKGLEVDPLSAVLRTNFAASLVITGKFEEGRRSFERMTETHPESSFGYNGLARYYYFMEGRLDEALAWKLQGVLKDPSEVRHRVEVAEIFLDLGDMATAARWIESAKALQPDNVDVLIAQTLLEFRLGQDASGLSTVEQALRRRLGQLLPNRVMLETLAQRDLAAGNPNEALDRYERLVPELVGPESGPLSVIGAYYAPDYVRVLRAAGKDRMAGKLLTQVINVFESRPDSGLLYGNWGLPAAYALAGRDDDALEALRTMVEAGVRAGWWYAFDRSTALAHLRDHPDFEALRIEVAADMEKQLEDVRRMERNGELPVVPGMEPEGGSSGAPPI